MRASVVALIAAFVSVVGLGCKENNPDYCASASRYHYSCAAADAAAQDAKKDAGNSPDVGDALDAPAEAGDAHDAPEAGDTAADLLVDLPTEPKPICTTDNECPADGGKLACFAGDAGPMCVECTKPTHCLDAKKPACDTTAHACVECLGTGTECTFDPKLPACNAATKKCVACVDNSKCTTATPICDANACRICRSDAECKDIGPGICVDWDGHCATNAEVVLLQGGACTPAGMLYCTGATAVAALNADSPILLVRGPDAVGMLSPPSVPPARVLIVGRLNATVAAGAGDAAGIDIPSAHKVWVRDLTVSGGTVGIIAESSSELHVTRVVVSNNGKGGIKTIDASYDITNTIVVGNMAGLDTGGVAFGGVRLGDVPGAGTARFENNTVVDNKSIGLSCKTSHDVSTSIVHGNLGGDSVNCAGAVCCGAADPNPLFDASYHLMSGSPCIDKLTANAMSPTIDIQSQPRPTVAGKLDCGADEFVQ